MTSESPSVEDLLRLQNQVLEQIVFLSGAQTVLDALCGLVEEQLPGSTCVHMRVDPETGGLHTSAAPRLSSELARELDVTFPSEAAGSCSAAVRTGEVVIVEDTSRDPRWADRRELAARNSIHACWAMPVFSRSGGILGSFAIARGEPGRPTDRQLLLLETAAHLAGIAIDRHEVDLALHEQKRLLASIVEGSEDPIWVKDEGRRYLLANNADARGVREDPRDIRGLTDEDLYPPEMAQRTRQLDEQVLRTGRGCDSEEEYDNPVEGKRRFLVRRSPLVDEVGRTWGLVGVARDVTSLRRKEEAVRRAQKLESLGVLAGGIAHDFNNLLTPILGDAERALSGLSEEELRTSLTRIRTCAMRAAGLTDQMIAYAGRKEISPETLSLPQVLEGVTELLVSSISRRATLLFDIEDDLPHVVADPSQLRQVLMNVLSNASDALENEPGEIVVSMRAVTVEEAERDAVPRPGRYVLIEVSDTGVGMNPETLTRIFDPFFTTKSEGRGLGLASVQSIVGMLGGAIRARSSPGVGTTFSIHVPVSEGRAAVVSPAPPLKEWSASGLVLVIDDEDPVRQLFQTILERTGMRVWTARDGRAGLELFDEHASEIDLVVLDLSTPRMRGKEVYERLKGIRSDVPVLVTSGHSEGRMREEFGSDPPPFLKKPFQVRELLALVQELLGTTVTTR